MRVAALAVGEGGEEEEEEEGEDDDEEEEEEKEAQARAGHHHGARGPAMGPAATVAVGGRSRWPATTCPFLFVLLLLLPVWILTTVVNASPLHPAPPYRGESRFTFLCWLVRLVSQSIPEPLYISFEIKKNIIFIFIYNFFVIT